jgi:hypothetical protein
MIGYWLLKLCVRSKPHISKVVKFLCLENI